MGLAIVGCEIKSEPAYKDCFDAYLQRKGWIKEKQPRKPDGTKYTVGEWCREKRPKRMIVNVSNHLTCIIDGKCNDIWNCTGKTVLNYWVLP